MITYLPRSLCPVASLNGHLAATTRRARKDAAILSAAHPLDLAFVTSIQSVRATLASKFADLALPCILARFQGVGVSLPLRLRREGVFVSCVPLPGPGSDTCVLPLSDLHTVVDPDSVLHFSAEGWPGDAIVAWLELAAIDDALAQSFTPTHRSVLRIYGCSRIMWLIVGQRIDAKFGDTTLVTMVEVLAEVRLVAAEQTAAALAASTTASAGDAAAGLTPQQLCIAAAQAVRGCDETAARKQAKKARRDIREGAVSGVVRMGSQ